MLTHKVGAARRRLAIAQVGFDHGKTSAARGMLDVVARELAEIEADLVAGGAPGPVPLWLSEAAAADPAAFKLPINGGVPADRPAVVRPIRFDDEDDRIAAEVMSIPAINDPGMTWGGEPGEELTRWGTRLRRWLVPADVKATVPEMVGGATCLVVYLGLIAAYCVGWVP